MCVKPVLESTVALVTGASSGIGAAAARALASQGAAVALAARRRDRLDTLAADIRGQGGTALVLESDITDQQQATDAVERTVADLGRLDTLVNNAGVMLLGPAAGAPLAEWQQMVELNVLEGEPQMGGEGIQCLEADQCAKDDGLAQLGVA